MAAFPKSLLLALCLALSWLEVQADVGHQHGHGASYRHSHSRPRSGNGGVGGGDRNPHVRQAPGIRSSAYYVSWATYARNYNPQDLPINDLTHVFYAFANVRPENGTVYLTDLWADVQKTYPTDNATATGNNLYGALKQIFLQKKRNRNLKSLLSIGGWTYSPNFAPAASTEEGRQLFATTAVQILQDTGFDGLDIDWEYPANEVEAENWVKLLQVTRQALDSSAAANNQTRFLLTVACPAGPDHYTKLKIAEMDQHLDFWNLMAYDYSGGFAQPAAHMTNIFASQMNPASTPFNTTGPVEYYIRSGVQPSKLSLGIPLYGRQFVNTSGLGQPYDSVGTDGSWEAGNWDYKALPRPGSSEFWDPSVGASWSYDNSTRTLISYDTVDNVIEKARFARNVGLGGSFYWEASGDKPAGQGGLIHTFLQAYANTTEGGSGSSLQVSQNQLHYPHSTYDNVRAGFLGEG